MNAFAEPTWTTPEEVVTVNKYLYKDLTIQDLTGVVLRLLQAHFSSAWEILNPALRSYLWTKGGNILDIRPGFEIKDTTQARCTIIVTRKDTEEGLKDLARTGLAVTGTGLGFSSLPENTTSHWTFLKIPYTVTCEAGTGPESEALAEEVYRWMMRYGPKLKEEFRLFAWEPGPLGETKKNPERGANVFATPVVLVCWVHKAWSLMPQTIY